MEHDNAHRSQPWDYFKYHGLGNDYLVMHPGSFEGELTPQAARLICDRHRGVGADGVLWGPLAPAALGINAGDMQQAPALRIINPDGSEGEKSGNGLRIFIRFLWEQGIIKARDFEVHTAGGAVKAHVLADDGSQISVEMGRVSFNSEVIPVTGAPREVLREALVVEGEHITFSAATVGNPHCVVLVDDPTPQLAKRIGPLLENHANFANRTNVQFMRVLDEHRIQIEIWERGAGYTLASGTSSCAAAAVACRLGLCRSPVEVQMQGGTLEIGLDEDYSVTMEGAVASVGAGRFSDEFLKLTGMVRKYTR